MSWSRLPLTPGAVANRYSGVIIRVGSGVPRVPVKPLERRVGGPADLAGCAPNVPLEPSLIHVTMDRM